MKIWKYANMKMNLSKETRHLAAFKTNDAAGRRISSFV